MGICKTIIKRNMEAAQPVSVKENFEKKNNDTKNTIKMKFKIESWEVNKATKILYNISEKRSDCDIKELNGSNTELFINGKKYDYKSYFIPEKKGLYEIKLNIKILMKNYCCLFYGINNLESLNLSSFNTQNVTNMSYMFYNCKNLQKINLSSFNTQNVTDMNNMFYNCENLESLNLSSFNTQNVTNMSKMFSYCKKLKSLDLSSFNTQNVTDMNNMFSYCYNLESIDLSSFNTQNVTDMREMFSYCKNLQSINLSSFNTQKVTNMSSMFYYCSKIQNLDLSSFNYNINVLGGADNMFYNCNLKTIVMNIEQKNFIPQSRAKIIYV